MYININIEKTHYMFQYNYFFTEILLNNKNINLKKEFLINYFFLKKQFFTKFKKQFTLYDFFLLISIENFNFNLFNFYKLKLCKKKFLKTIKIALNQLIEFKFIKVYDFINKLYFYLLGSSGDIMKKYKNGICKKKNKLYINENNLYTKFFFYKLYIFLFNKFLNFTPYFQNFLTNLFPLLLLFQKNITNNILNDNFNNFLNTVPYSNLKIFKINFWSILNNYNNNILILVKKIKNIKKKFNQLFFLKKKKFLIQKQNFNNTGYLNTKFINYFNNLKQINFQENIYFNFSNISNFPVDEEITFKRNSKLKNKDLYS